jgi:hypothetical protein
VTRDENLVRFIHYRSGNLPLKGKYLSFGAHFQVYVPPLEMELLSGGIHFFK